MASAAQAPAVRWSECGNYWYDEAAAEVAVNFFPDYLCFTDAEWAGKPFTLEPWEADDIIRPLFGWKRRDGTRRYRRVIVWIPRKNGKTELAAGVSLLALVGDGEMGGQVYSIAADKEQASLVFNKAVTMVNLSSRLSNYLQCFKPSIYCAELAASFKPLSGRPGGKHGLSMTGLVGDEMHEWRDGDLYTFVHQSSAARRQPIEFLISTAGNRQGFGWELWEYCLKVMEGDIDDPETLIVIYAADREDDWTDPQVWAKANPNLGVSVKLDYLEAECRKAKESPRLENDFKRYHLNIWTEQAVRWLPMDKWGPAGKRWQDPQFEAELEGQDCFGGMDLSSTTDLTTYVLWFPPNGDRRQWRKLTRVFVPEDTIAIRSRRDRQPYEQWRKSGALIATPGNVVDYDYVKASIIADAMRFRMLGMGIDPFLATQIAIQLQAEGLNTEFVRQGFLSLSAPSKELERLVLSLMIDHGGHPIARWCAGNVAVATDAAGNIKPDKSKSTERIDVIAADVNALALSLSGMEDPTSVYEDRGLVEIEIEEI